MVCQLTESPGWAAGRKFDPIEATVSTSNSLLAMLRVHCAGRVQWRTTAPTAMNMVNKDGM